MTPVALALIMATLKATQVNADINQNDIDRYKSIIMTVASSYDADKPFHENFFSLLHYICPYSVQCDNGNATELNFTYIVDSFNDTFQFSDGLFQNWNKSLIYEARNDLKSIFNDMQGCCTKCSCAEECRERNNCCPINSAGYREGTNRPLKARQNCEFPTAYGINHNRQELLMSYYMVTDCFNTTMGEDIMRKCKHPNNSMQAEITPVYSRKSESIYRNKFCAECNNEDSFISWELQIIFEEYLGLSRIDFISDSPVTFYQKLIKSLRLFRVILVPPDEVIKRKEDFLCIPQKYISNTDCYKQTLLTENQKEFFKIACSYYLSPYQLLSNPFCYICNTIKIESDHQTCSEYDSRNRQKSFSAVLLPWKETSVGNLSTSNRRHSQCACTEYSMDQKGECRQVVCPIGKAYHDCSCETFLGKITGMVVKIFVELYPQSPTVSTVNLFTKTSPETLVKIIQGGINSIFRKNWGPMKIVHAVMYRETSHSDRYHLKFRILFIMKSKSDMDNIPLLKNIYEALNSGMNIPILNTPMIMSLGKIFDLRILSDSKLDVEHDSNHDNTFVYETLFGLQESGYSTALYSIYGYQTLTKLLFCSRVTLNDEEMVSLQNFSSNAGYGQDELDLIFDESDSQICFDDFLSIFLPTESKGCRICNDVICQFIVSVGVLYIL